MERLSLDPLGKVKEALRDGKIGPDMADEIFSRMPVLESMVRKVEEVTGLSYPPHYVMPLLILVRSEAELGLTGVYYARNVPVVVNSRLNLLVEFTAPLLVYASKPTLQAVVAHEFTHYLELVKRFSSSPTSSPSPSTMFEATYKDMQESVPPEVVFGKRSSLATAIGKRFSEGFSDEPLNKRVIRHWLQKKLPYVMVRPDDNAVRIPLSAVANANLDSAALRKVTELA
jgi:hypothetical protein